MTHTAPKARLLSVSPIHVAVLALLAGIGAARAQTTPATLAAPAALSDSKAIPEVLVTATKRSTSLQSTPLAITALNAAALEDAHVQTIQDVVNLVPGFQATGQGDHGVITMTLRGVGNDSAKTEYADPEVATFVDGIYSPRPEGATALLFDLDAIEVLRGPQGTLWGRNSSVGAVNMQTAKPVLGANSASVEAGIGNFNRLGARGALNVPLGETAALRIAFVHEQHDGYVDFQKLPVISLASQRAAFVAGGGNPANFQPINPNLFTTAGPKYSSQDQSALRLSLLWKPTPAMTWNIAYEKFSDRGTPSMNLMQTARAGQDMWSTLADTAPSLKRDTNSVRSRIDFALSDSANLSYIAGYSRFSGASTFDQDGGATVPTSFTTGATYQANNTESSNYANYSHELELQSAGKQQVDWLLGLYYAAEKNDIRFDIPIFNGTQQGTVSWQGSFIQPKETVASSAAFGQATWNYDATVPQVPVNGSIDPRVPGQGYSPGAPSNDGSYSGNKVTGLARVAYDIDRQNMVYASVSTGYKSGGLQDGGRPYGAETLTNYELGSKHTMLGGAVKWNNALYYEKFKDFQFSAPVTNPDGSHTLVTNNAEGANIYGFESELAAKLGADDKVQFTFAYTHAVLGHLIGGSNDYALPACSIPGIGTCLDVSGNRMPHTPSASLQFQYQHTFRLADGATLTPRLSTHYETASWLSVFNLGEGDRQKAYTRTDLGLRYNRPHSWWVDAFARNVANVNTKTSAMNSFGPWMAQYLPPRTIGINTGIDF
jgi:iron complex outermembrane receptor protein